MTNNKNLKDQRIGASAMLSLLKERNFCLLWAGEGISLLGDQFYLIALPWLVLQLTGDAFAMGSVLAVASIPRAFFILLGGVLTDRFSPRLVMLTSNLFRMALVALLTLFVLTGMIKLWMLYIFAFIFGLADAFFYPASAAIVPQLVKDEQLQAGNALIHGTAQLSVFAGPVLAGVLIGLLSGESTQIGMLSEVGAFHQPSLLSTESANVPEMQGIGLSFAVDACTFLVSAIMLWLMSIRKPHQKSEKTGQSMWLSIRTTLSSMWKDKTLRAFFFIVAAINLLFNGPVTVGVPVLADTRFSEGAMAFGLLTSAFGGGSLLGTLLAAVLPRPAPRRLGPMLLTIISLLGVGLALLAFVSSTQLAALVGLVTGTANGYVLVLFVTWLQARTPQAMQGRMMSLLLFASLGLVPISMALSGALIEMNANALFVGAGSLLTLTMLYFASNPAVQGMGLKKQFNIRTPILVRERTAQKKKRRIHQK
ncbi:MAG: MFS transporter [Ardenticatenaceae bacterium]